MIATWNRHLCARDKFLVNYCTVSKEKMGFRRCSPFSSAHKSVSPDFYFIFTILHLSPIVAPTFLSSFHQKNIFRNYNLEIKKSRKKKLHRSTSNPFHPKLLQKEKDYLSICNNHLINSFFSFLFSSNLDIYPFIL